MDAPRRLDARVPFVLLLAGVLAVIPLYFAWGWVAGSKVFTANDIRVYFASSRWAAGEGTLYRDVFSEYPLVPNLIFGAFRALAEAWRPLPSAFDSFTWLWVSGSWLLYLVTAYLIAARVFPRSEWVWLAMWLAPA